MSKRNDLSRSLVPLNANTTLIAASRLCRAVPTRCLVRRPEREPRRTERFLTSKLIGAIVVASEAS